MTFTPIPLFLPGEDMISQVIARARLRAPTDIPILIMRDDGVRLLLFHYGKFVSLYGSEDGHFWRYSNHDHRIIGEVCYTNNNSAANVIKHRGKAIYLIMNFRFDSVRLSLYVHRAIYTLFVAPIPRGYQVDHLDGCTLNNAASNLEAVTPEENNRRRNAARGFTPFSADRLAKKRIRDHHQRHQCAHTRAKVESLKAARAAQRQARLAAARAQQHNNKITQQHNNTTT